jgi:hypothetical protein
LGAELYSESYIRNRLQHNVRNALTYTNSFNEAVNNSTEKVSINVFQTQCCTAILKMRPLEQDWKDGTFIPLYSMEIPNSFSAVY